MPESDAAREAAEAPRARLKPLPDHLFDAVLSAVRDSLGPRWGEARGRLSRIAHLVRGAVGEMDDVYVAADFDVDSQRGLRIHL